MFWKQETENFRRKCKLSIVKALKVHKTFRIHDVYFSQGFLFVFFPHLPKWILQMSGAMLLVSGSFVLCSFFPLAPVFWMVVPVCSLANSNQLARILPSSICHFWHPARKCIDIKYSRLRFEICWARLVAYICETAVNRGWNFRPPGGICIDDIWDDIWGCHVSPQSPWEVKKVPF